MQNNISKLIRQKRKYLNYTIEELAEHSKVSVSLISKIERGEVENISVKKLDSIAAALDMQISDFFIDEEITDINTINLINYLKTLPEDKRSNTSELIMNLINL